MARPKSEDRRAALLDAATEVFAEHGLAAPTALVSKTAGVSEGSFFTYFETKDQLLIALYRELRLDLAQAIARDYPRRGTVRARFQHMFTRWVTWGVEKPAARKALRHLTMSKAITPEVRAETAPAYAEIDRLHADARAQRKLVDAPEEMVSATLKAFSDMTMDLIAARPAEAEVLMTSGFEMLWGALSRRS